MTTSSDMWELNTQSFVIRLWLEEPGSADRPAVWRGHITHALTGSRRYVDSLAQITAFISIYLREMGVEV